MVNIRKKYLVAFLRVDQAHLGEPVSRRRIYILLVRRPPLSASNGITFHLSVSHVWISLGLDYPQFVCARDVALRKLKTHGDLEKHCGETYKLLTEAVPEGPTVPLDSAFILEDFDR